MALSQIAMSIVQVTMPLMLHYNDFIVRKYFYCCLTKTPIDRRYEVTWVKTRKPSSLEHNNVTR